jgi:hypothetical protein
MNYKKSKALMAAAAIAATAPLSVLAVIDMDGAATQKLAYNDDLKGDLTDGKVTVSALGGDINVTGSADFSIGLGATRIYRFDLTGATFKAASGTNLILTQEESVVANGAAVAGVGNTAVLQNVAAGTSTAMFLVSADAVGTPNDIDLSDNFVLTLGSLDVDPTATVNIKYTQYADVTNASAQTNALATKNFDMASFVSGSNYADVVEAADVEATVASNFSQFDTGKISNTLDALGFVNTANVLLDAAGAANATIINDGNATTAANSITASQVVTVTGDVSVGTFTSNTNADCATGGAGKIACTKAADNGSCSFTNTATQTPAYICLDLTGATAAGDVLSKGDYSIAFATNSAMDASLGSVVYDTTTVEIPYVTTYSGYNQRIFLDNRGTTAADYTTTFTTEDGVTAAGGTASTGSLAAGKMTTIKATDLVTFTDGSRGTATLEVESETTKLKVVTQIVDLGTGVTDTILLHPSTQQ